MATRPHPSAAVARAAESLHLSDVPELVALLHARELRGRGGRRFRTDAPRLASAMQTPVYLGAHEADGLLRLLAGLAASSQMLAMQMAAAQADGEDAAVPECDRVDLAEAVVSLARQARDALFGRVCRVVDEAEPIAAAAAIRLAEAA